MVTPTHSEEAEQAVLGAVMLDNAKLFDIGLAEADFYRADHQIIFRGVQALAEKNQPCDIVTLSEWLESRGQLEQAGGLAYIAGIAKDTPSAHNAAAYAGIVRDYSRIRRTRKQLTAALESVNNGEKVADIVAKLQVELESQNGGDYRTFRDVLQSGMSAIEEAQQRRVAGGIIGIPTGLAELDQRLGGLWGPKLIVLAARPSLGKTALANQIALNAAGKGFAVGKIELEMSAPEIALRSMALSYGINGTALANGDDAALAALHDGTLQHNIRDYPLYLDESTFHPAGIISRLAEWHRKHGIQLAIIDHLQLVETARTNRNQELGAVTRALKLAAKRLAIPIILLCQLNRDMERHQRKPILSDLRDSGEIEQDADVAMFLHGDLTQDDGGAREIEIGLLKNRGGRVGWLPQPLLFDGRTQTFSEPGYA